MIEKWVVAHDLAFELGGAERCTSALVRFVVPGATVYETAGDEEVTREIAPFGSRALVPCWLRVPPFAVRAVTPLLAGVLRLLPPVQGNLLASSYAYCHVRRATGLKIIYCHSPLRQVYSGLTDYFTAGPWATRVLNALFLPFRRIDARGAKEADFIVATNEIVAERVREYWGRVPDAIIPPPIDTVLFSPRTRDLELSECFLYVGRVVEPYKKVSLLLEVFRSLPMHRLLIVGDGKDRARLEAEAPSNVTFVGTRKGAELATLYSSCRALLFPSSDDFGMVPLEAMACGTPVIGFSGGGARYSVTETSGVLFDAQSVSSIMAAIEVFEQGSWASPKVRERALEFSTEKFTARFRKLLLSADGV